MFLTIDNSGEDIMLFPPILRLIAMQNQFFVVPEFYFMIGAKFFM